MILAFDTFYQDDRAKTVCVVFNSWTDEQPADVWTDEMTGIAEYEPGAFYKRELPCILRVLSRADLHQVEAIVIDGYVILDSAGKPGLGQRLYEQLPVPVPVIGVAKTRFAGNIMGAAELLRGDSHSPLYITAVGISQEAAAAHIRSMAGPYRMPALLRLLDGLTRQ